jgi:hypothetical protein
MTANILSNGRRARRWTPAMLGAALLASIGGCGLYKEGRAWLYGLQAYLYGFPLVVMDLTKAAGTAVPTAGEITAPINQFAVMTKYPDASFRAVPRTGLDTCSRQPGRISTRSRWSFRCPTQRALPRDRAVRHVEQRLRVDRQAHDRD